MALSEKAANIFFFIITFWFLIIVFSGLSSINLCGERFAIDSNHNAFDITGLVQLLTFQCTGDFPVFLSLFLWFISLLAIIIGAFIVIPW